MRYKRILLFGDYIQDVSVQCDCTRVCPEAPVPVLVPISSSDSAGGAGLVDANLKSLGLRVEALFGSWSKKTRYFVGNQLVMRVDQDEQNVAQEEDSIAYLLPELDKADLIVVSDYNKGSVTERIAKMLVGTGKSCYVDTKNQHTEWFAGRNVTLFPNQREIANVLGKEQMFERVIAKMGSEGARVIRVDADGYGFDEAVPTASRNVFSVIGAGDVFLAGYVWAQVEGLDPIASTRVANHLAGRSVEQVGTFVARKEDLPTLDSFSSFTCTFPASAEASTVSTWLQVNKTDNT